MPSYGPSRWYIEPAIYQLHRVSRISHGILLLLLLVTLNATVVSNDQCMIDPFQASLHLSYM
jgi:hypothetical protein